MTLPQQLRAIADRLEAADQARRAALTDLMEIGGGAVEVLEPLWDDASVLAADEEQRPAGVASLPAPAAAPIDAGAPMGLGTVGPSATGEGGATAPSEPHPVVEDVARNGGRSKRSGPSTSRREAKRTGHDGVHQESAPTAEGSTRVHCPDCDWVGKPGGLGVHRRHRHGHRAGQLAGTSTDPINCPDCGEAIAQKKNLARHRKVAHGWVPWQPTPVGVATSTPTIHNGKERWVCNRCTDSFTSRQARDLHQTSHPPIPDVEPLRSIGRGGSRGMNAQRRAA